MATIRGCHTLTPFASSPAIARYLPCTVLGRESDHGDAREDRSCVGDDAVAGGGPAGGGDAASLPAVEAVQSAQQLAEGGQVLRGVAPHHGGEMQENLARFRAESS